VFFFQSLPAQVIKREKLNSWTLITGFIATEDDFGFAAKNFVKENNSRS